jgi:8-oxo-dGTP pyrophosphatase MutT (NUDIX family)
VRRSSLPVFTRRPVQWAIHAVARFWRPLTMGVRAIVLDGQGHVLLVRHSYLPGWHFPGGGVEPGETILQAMRREAVEEAGIIVESEPLLHGIFLNRWRDHVVVYVVKSFRPTGRPVADWEIVESGFFDPGALPPGTTKATRARLRELLDAVPRAETW